MNKLKLLLSTLLLILAPSFAFATEETQKPDKYDGIEITVNINQAGADELATLLLGIGEAKAKRIVAYREEHGVFKSIDDLAMVKGIGAATVEKNRLRIML